jgi:AcrR family transcriptional regulator
VRSPQQQRSKQRSEQILAAARAIILQKGCANLTISEIAEVAGVTPGSMYQYYRNKAAIVLALGQSYVALSQQQLAQIFAEPVSSREQLGTLFLQVLEQHYQLYRDDPVVRDIWAGTVTDKAMQDLERQDNEQHLQFFFTVAKPLFPPAKAAELYRTLNLLLHFAIAGSRLALEQDANEGRATIDTAKQMVAQVWLQFCLDQQAKASD